MDVDSDESDDDGPSHAGNVPDTTVDDARARRLESDRASRMRERRQEAEDVLEVHKNLCVETQAALGNLRSLCAKMAALDHRMKNPLLRRLQMARDLRFDSLFNDLQVASKRIGQAHGVSQALNAARRGSIFSEIESDRSPFE